jgi:AAA domain
MTASHDIPARFAENFSGWRRLLETVPAESRAGIFDDAAVETVSYVNEGLDRILAIDELTDIAQSYQLDIDQSQETIARAFEDATKVQTLRPVMGNGQRRQQQPQSVPLKPIEIISKSQFVGLFRPLDYLVDGMLQRGYIYALTGATGHAKSAVALLLAELISSPDKNHAMFGRHRVEKGKVLYFVGENPMDIVMRIIGADSQRENEADAKLDQLYLVNGRIDLEKRFDEIRSVARPLGKLDLVIIDTSAAYFLGDEELSNTQMAQHARSMRRLTELPGSPCVLVLCHPIKHAQEPAQLLPRGGGAFLAEVDGNMTLWKRDDVLVDLHYTKMRGPGFEQMTFRLDTIRTPRLVDTQGRMLPTVRAIAVTESEQSTQEQRSVDDEDRVMAWLLEHPNDSVAEVATALGWVNDKSEPTKMRVQRAIVRLSQLKPALIRKGRNRWELTDSGKQAAAKANMKFSISENATRQESLKF